MQSQLEKTNWLLLFQHENFFFQHKNFLKWGVNNVISIQVYISRKPKVLITIWESVYVLHNGTIQNHIKT